MEEGLPPFEKPKGSVISRLTASFPAGRSFSGPFPGGGFGGEGGERWHQLKSASIALRFGHQRRLSPGSCRYDPLSYAQNFEEKAFDGDDDENFYRGFSSRFVPIAPATKVNPPEGK